MQQGPTDRPVTERDLDEVLQSLEVELFGPPKKSRQREDSTTVHVLPPRD